MGASAAHDGSVSMADRPGETPINSVISELMITCSGNELTPGIWIWQESGGHEELGGLHQRVTCGGMVELPMTTSLTTFGDVDRGGRGLGGFTRGAMVTGGKNAVGAKNVFRSVSASVPGSVLHVVPRCGPAIERIV
jgi:hypothetical protein